MSRRAHDIHLINKGVEKEVKKFMFFVRGKEPIHRFGPYDANKIKKKCLEWLEENFGILARQLIDFEISQKNEADLIFGITTVEFSFEAPSGEIMESAAFLDDCDIY